MKELPGCPCELNCVYSMAGLSAVKTYTYPIKADIQPPASKAGQTGRKGYMYTPYLNWQNSSLPASNCGLHVHPLHMNPILPLSRKTRPLQRRARSLTEVHFGHLPLRAKPTPSSIVCWHNFGDIPIQAKLPLSIVGCLDNLRARWTGQSSPNLAMLQH